MKTSLVIAAILLVLLNAAVFVPAATEYLPLIAIASLVVAVAVLIAALSLRPAAAPASKPAVAEAVKPAPAPAGVKANPHAELVPM